MVFNFYNSNFGAVLFLLEQEQDTDTSNCTEEGYCNALFCLFERNDKLLHLKNYFKQTFSLLYLKKCFNLLK